MNKLENKVAVITGASDGLWKAIATKLIEKWAIVIGIARTEEKLLATQKLLGDNFKPYTADLSNLDQLENVYNKILSEYSEIDILVNNAAIWFEGSIEEHNLDVLHSLIMTNIFGVMWSIQKIYPWMKKRKSGQILNINSTAGVDICKEWAPYSWTKYAITRYTQWLNQEATENNVKVMQIHPGGMDTNIFESFKKWYGKQDWMMDKNKVADLVIIMLSQDNDVVIDSLVVRKLGMI